MTDHEDFYEDDEPLERIMAIRTRPYDVVTAPRAPRAHTARLYFHPVGSDASSWTSDVLGETACR